MGSAQPASECCLHCIPGVSLVVESASENTVYSKSRALLLAILAVLAVGEMMMSEVLVALQGNIPGIPEWDVVAVLVTHRSESDQ